MMPERGGVDQLSVNTRRLNPAHGPLSDHGVEFVCAELHENGDRFLDLDVVVFGGTAESSPFETGRLPAVYGPLLGTPLIVVDTEQGDRFTLKGPLCKEADHTVIVSLWSLLSSPLAGQRENGFPESIVRA